MATGCGRSLACSVRVVEVEDSVSPVLDEHTVDFVSHSAEQTVRLGRRLGRLFEGGEVICLTGDLGTGKTCLVQGVGAGLGIEEQITSPTFTLGLHWPLALMNTCTTMASARSSGPSACATFGQRNTF